MQFGRDLKRRETGPFANAGVLELLPLGALKRETAAVGLKAHQAAKGERAALLGVYARMLRELARRSGEAETMTKAASAAEWAAREARSRIEAAAARLEQAETALVAAEVFGDRAATEAAQGWLDQAAPDAYGPLSARVMALRARIQSSRSVGSGDLDAAVETAGAFDSAIAELDRHVRADEGAKAVATAGRCDRAEFLIDFGVRLKDKTLLTRAEADLAQLAERLDADVLPLSWARVEALRGAALAALGDLTGEPKRFADAVAVLATAADHIDFDHSPLDRARISHAMGRSLHALAEACEDEGMYDHALVAFDQAAVALEGQRSPMRALVAHDRAACVAARAEAAGDLAALARAEAAFKSELVFQAGASDPLGWAVAQLALTRVYRARAALAGEPLDSAAAAMSLNEALEVFTDRGLKALADEVVDALAQLRGE